MPPEFPDYYVKELRYIEESVRVSGIEHAKIGTRLGIQAGDIGDHYVQQLAQSFAFVAAGTRMGIDRFGLEVALRKLEGLAVNHAAPLPSLGVARFEPDAKGAHSPQGLMLPRGTRLNMTEGGEGHTECVFLTTQPVRLRPVAITQVKPGIPALYPYLHSGQDVSRIRGALRLRFATLNGTPFNRFDGLTACRCTCVAKSGWLSSFSS